MRSNVAIIGSVADLPLGRHAAIFGRVHRAGCAGHPAGAIPSMR
jgi:hypothetical protein